MHTKVRTEGGEENPLGNEPINNTQLINCTYDAPVATHFTHAGVDYSLHPGETYNLPADIDFVKSLIGQNKLKPSK